jgi:hypothetical protein
MRLYRGIAVPARAATSTIDAIREEGLVLGAGFWSLSVHDLKSRLPELWEVPRLSTRLTRPGDEEPVPRICACARRGDALYYACSHNRDRDRDAPIVVVFEADLVDVIVDGRDFLSTVMQLGSPTASRTWLERIFGTAVLRYADRAWVTEDQDSRISVYDLAIQDHDVILAHSENEILLGGRYRTRFASAFMVRSPVPAARIFSVERVAPGGYVLPEIEVSLDQALGR